MAQKAKKKTVFERDINIRLEWNDDRLETRMSIDGKMFTDYSQAHRMIIALLKEIDAFEAQFKDE